MKRALAVVLVTLSLGGCAQIQAVQKVTEIATKSVDSPVTTQELYQIEASLRIATEALLTYRRACLAGTVDVNCRENIRVIQPYTRQARAILPELRSFVKSGDQINAIVLYKRLGNIYNTITTEAAKRSINLGA